MEQILLIDTSADNCTVGIVRDGQLIQALQHTERQSQAAIINPLIEQLCAETKTKLAELDAVAVCSGPGSYTGLRIGLAAAKGICFAINKPLIMHHKLEILAQQQIQINNDYWQYAVLITAREGEFFYAAYDAEMNILQGPLHGNTASIQSLIDQLSVTSLCTFGDENAKKTFGENVQLAVEIDFALWSSWATGSFLQKDFADTATAVPFYMKEVFIFEPKNKGLQ